MHKLFTDFCTLKAYLRLILDPERVRTQVAAREALAEAHALIYRCWREHLKELTTDDLLARQFFEIFPFSQFLYTICKEAARIDGGAIAALPDDLTIGEIKETADRLKLGLESLDSPLGVFRHSEDYQLLRAVKKLGESLEPLCEQYLDARIEGEWSLHQVAKQKSESISDPTKDESEPATSGKEQEVPVSSSSMDAR